MKHENVHHNHERTLPNNEHGNRIKNHRISQKNAVRIQPHGPLQHTLSLQQKHPINQGNKLQPTFIHPLYALIRRITHLIRRNTSPNTIRPQRPLYNYHHRTTINRSISRPKRTITGKVRSLRHTRNRSKHIHTKLMRPVLSVNYNITLTRQKRSVNLLHSKRTTRHKHLPRTTRIQPPNRRRHRNTTLNIIHSGQNRYRRTIHIGPLHIIRRRRSRPAVNPSLPNRPTSLVNHQNKAITIIKRTRHVTHLVRSIIKTNVGNQRRPNHPIHIIPIRRPPRRNHLTNTHLTQRPGRQYTNNSPILSPIRHTLINPQTVRRNQIQRRTGKDLAGARVVRMNRKRNKQVIPTWPRTHGQYNTINPQPPSQIRPTVIPVQTTTKLAQAVIYNNTKLISFRRTTFLKPKPFQSSYQPKGKTGQ